MICFEDAIYMIHIQMIIRMCVSHDRIKFVSFLLCDSSDTHKCSVPIARRSEDTG